MRKVNLEQSLSKKPSRRRWFQFSLRTMIVATAIFCILLATWIIPSERQRRAVLNLHNGYSFDRERRGFLKDNPVYEDEDYDYTASWSGDIASNLSESCQWYDHYFKNVKDINCRDIPEIHWSDFPHLKKICFEHDYSTELDKDFTEKLLFTLSVKNRELESLELEYWSLNQRGLSNLASFTQLDELCLDTVNLEELNLDPLLSLKSLKVLSLVRSRVRDVELKKLQKLPHLEILGVTVDGSIREQLEIINGFKNLKTIYIERSDPHLCFNISSDQFRKLLSENAELHDDTQLLPILAAPAKRKRAEADARAAIENPAEP